MSLPVCNSLQPKDIVNLNPSTAQEVCRAELGN